MLDICVNPDGIIGREQRTSDEIYDKLMIFKEAGFNTLDCLCRNRGEPYCKMEWPQYMRLALLRADMSVKQTVFPICASVYNTVPPVRLSINPMDIYQIDIALRTNIEWGCTKTVIRPLTPHPFYWDFELKNYIKFNTEYIKWILERSVRYGVDICIETMPPMIDNIKCFGSETEHLIKLDKSINHEQVGFAVDTENLRRCNLNISETINKLSSKLFALRITDPLTNVENSASMPFDDFMLDDLALSLKAAKYKGALSFKVDPERFNTPNSKAISAYLSYIYQRGSALKEKICAK